MGALLRKIDALGRKGTVRLVLDNGRYQHCVLVKDLAKSLNIELLFLSSCSPNLNLIERLRDLPRKRCCMVVFTTPSLPFVEKSMLSLAK